MHWAKPINLAGTISHMKSLKLTSLIIALLWLGNAQAGVEESLKAVQAKDYQTALSEARKAADANDPRAYFILGLINESGLGITANKTEAFSWYEKAAKAGVVGAFAKISYAFMRGDGTTDMY